MNIVPLFCEIDDSFQAFEPQMKSELSADERTETSLPDSNFFRKCDQYRNFAIFSEGTHR